VLMIADIGCSMLRRQGQSVRMRVDLCRARALESGRCELGYVGRAQRMAGSCRLSQQHLGKASSREVLEPSDVGSLRKTSEHETGPSCVGTAGIFSCFD